MSALPPAPVLGPDPYAQQYAQQFDQQPQAFSPSSPQKVPFWPFLVAGLVGLAATFGLFMVTTWVGGRLDGSGQGDSGGSTAMFGVGLILIIPVMIAVVHTVLRLILPRRGIVDPVQRPVARYALASVVAVVVAIAMVVVSLVTTLLSFAAASGNGSEGELVGVFLILGVLAVNLVSAIAFSLMVWVGFKSDVRAAQLQRPVPLATGFATYQPPTYSQPTYPQPSYRSQDFPPPRYQQDGYQQDGGGDVQDRQQT